VNRVVTADGLFQRLALVRSALKYERDFWGVWWTSIGKRETERRRDPAAPREPRTLDDAAKDLRAYVISGDGPDAARTDEHAADLALRLLGTTRVGS
jgi:hypothetical protein